jgi:hypothetical protein
LLYVNVHLSICGDHKNDCAQGALCADYQVRVESLDRRVKAGVFTVLILLLGYRMSYIDLAIAAFVVCVYARSQLPEEVSSAEISLQLQKW